MVSRLKSMGGAPVWVIHSSAWAEIGGFQTSVGGQGFVTNLGDGLGLRLMGYPIVMSQHMQRLGLVRNEQATFFEPL
jgi:hypothetical protein